MPLSYQNPFAAPEVIFTLIFVVSTSSLDFALLCYLWRMHYKILWKFIYLFLPSFERYINESTQLVLLRVCFLSTVCSEIHLCWCALWFIIALQYSAVDGYLKKFWTYEHWYYKTFLYVYLSPEYTFLLCVFLGGLSLGYRICLQLYYQC